MTQGWKKAVSVMLCAAMILSVSSVMISADDENKPAAENVIEQTQPESENHTETPEENNENTDNNTTEGEQSEPETSEAVKNVIDQLEALPKLDDLTEETDAEALKKQVESAKKAFDALTEEEKANISEELKDNLADLEFFFENRPTTAPEEAPVGEQIPMVELEDTTEQTELKGQGTEQEPYLVSNEEEFKAAIAKGGHIQLQSDIQLSNHCTISQKTTLEFGNYSIKNEGKCVLVIGADVTFNGGEVVLKAEAGNRNAVQVNSKAHLTVNGTTIRTEEGTGNAAIMLLGGEATIKSGKIDGEKFGIIVAT